MNVIIASLVGEFIKLTYKLRLRKPRYGLNETEHRDKNVIVSLTSYGRRVKATLPYTLASLLNQTYKPDKIICWLDNEHWSRSNLPKSIKRLEQYGIEISFCRDLLSYKKLLPTLERYPDGIIITVDDDVYYKPSLVATLVNAYQEKPMMIPAFRTSTFLFDVMDNPDIYWCGEGHPWNYDFACGCGGILYAKELLNNDIMNLDLITTLAPKADDLWFYFMEMLNGTHVNMVTSDENKTCFYPLDSFYQKFHKGGSLNAENLEGMGNNKQIKAIMEHYGISIQDLKNFSETNPALKK